MQDSVLRITEVSILHRIEFLQIKLWVSPGPKVIPAYSWYSHMF